MLFYGAYNLRSSEYLLEFFFNFASEHHVHLLDSLTTLLLQGEALLRYICHYHGQFQN